LSGQRIKPGEVGTPFQLLAAAMVFVVLLDSCFVSGAAVLEDVPGASIALVGAAVLYPPVVLGGLFVLQTRHRPSLLADDAFLRLKKDAAELRTTITDSGFDVTMIPGTAPTAGLSSRAEAEIRNRAEELERSVSASLLGDDASRLRTVAEASRELGHAALVQGRWREGAEHLAEFLAVNPRDWGEWFAQGTAYANAREGPETDALAVLAYTRAVETLPPTANRQTRARLLTYRAGVLKRDLQKHSLAEVELEKARAFAEQGSYEADDIHYNLAAILSMRGETDAAMRELRQIGDRWYFGAISEHERDYFANLSERDDFRHLLAEKLVLNEDPFDRGEAEESS